MRILSMSLFRSSGNPAITPTMLCSGFELSSLSFFQRSSAKEFAIFLSRTVAQRTLANQRQRVPENEYVCYAHAKRNGLIGVLIADEEYPSRVAFSILAAVMDDFEAQMGRTWTTAPAEDNCVPWPQLEKAVKEYQDPGKADRITAIQRDLDETKVVMQKNIDAILERGEKLDILVEKSNDLSASSKGFYKTAKKHNSCCVVM
jgi:synaptobrevin family protein YKT6